MHRIGVLLGGRVAPMESLARRIDGEADMRLIGVVHSWDALVEKVKEEEVDVVLWETSRSRTPARLDELLFSVPRLRVFSIVAAGPEVILHELRPYATPLGNVKVNGLLDAIRGRNSEEHAVSSPGSQTG